jgi:hypothetical protein
MADVDDESIDAQFVRVVEPGALKESIDVDPFNPLVHVVLIGTEPQGVEERVGTVLDPAKDERVDPLCLASVWAVHLDRPIGKNVVKPDDGLQFVLEVKCSTIICIPGEGPKT